LKQGHKWGIETLIRLLFIGVLWRFITILVVTPRLNIDQNIGISRF